VEADYFDALLIEAAKTLHRQREAEGFMKAARLIGQVLAEVDQVVGDPFLEYRLRQLIKSRVFSMEGSLEAMRYYSVRLNQA
jgi:hypothetical protein